MSDPHGESPGRPDWEGLLDLAVGQAGYFTTAQAKELGFSPELLIHHRKRRRIERVRRGIYRVRHLPPQEDEQLVELWLWSGREGIFSHRTALLLHELSEELPEQVDMTVPETWRSRRLRVPAELKLYFADVPPEERQQVGFVPVTTSLRALRECLAAGMEEEQVRRVVELGVKRRLLPEREIDDALARPGRHGDRDPVQEPTRRGRRDQLARRAPLAQLT